MSDDAKRPTRPTKLKLNNLKLNNAAKAPVSAEEVAPKPSAPKPDSAEKPAKAMAPKSSASKPQANKSHASKGSDRPPSRLDGRPDSKPSSRPRRDGAKPASQLGRASYQEPHQSRPRVFFALKVPAEIATPLGEAQKALRGNWRPVRPDQFHVTLVYLPSVDPARIDDLKRLGVRLAQECSPLDIRLRGTGYFPNEGSPRVWFVKVEGEGLDELAASLRTGAAALGLETEDTNFRAHITLARKKGPAPRVAPKIFELGWQAPQLVLYRSHLQKTGPIYEELSTFKFRG